MSERTDQSALSPENGQPSPVRRSAQRRFVAATLIDALGSGLWMPFVLLFLVNAQDMPLTEAGAALSLGALLGLAAGPLSGSLMDRLGAQRTLIASNVIRLGAFLCYPLVETAWHVVAVSLVVSVGDRLFWTVNAPVVNALTTEREADKLLGTQTIGRFVGAGIGAGATALIPDLNSAATYHLLAYLNAASFGVAALLLLNLHIPMDKQEGTGGSANAGWGAVLRDRTYVAFCVMSVLYTLASIGKYSILPILVLEFLHGPQWVPGVALGIGTLTLVSVQRLVTRVAAKHSRARGLVLAAVIFACSFCALTTVTVLPLSGAIAVILVVSVTFAVAEALFAPLLTAAAAAAAPAGAQGRASALFQLSWAVSMVSGPVLLTSLLSVGNGALWLTLTVTSAAAVPAVLALRRRMTTVLG
ncbi:MFS transporter [Lentzea sp.]|uniref:MFS transporter n=1 Tax=Lentzea sp. TaxID=56099 RepID=UPI002BFFF2BF|nr:MFS transporter [Lentzea sp.]HUQ56471.1 MFS transporter [Lentzea sp.]